jgi:SpoIID/LytB domain protein
VTYTQAEIAELLHRRSGIDFGAILNLVPQKRGESGRIIELKIVGTKQTVVVGKELEIRKWLSNSHLYSSAFVVDKAGTTNGIPQQFTLTGAGWGHGVGLCQIGAAVMGEKGYLYDQILLHYFRGAELERIYP